MLETKFICEEEASAEDFIKEVQKLTVKDKKKILHMIKGYKLLCKS